MSDYEYVISPDAAWKRYAAQPKRPAVTVEVTRNPVGHGMVVSFLHPHTSTSYHVSGRRYDRLVRIANSGAVDVEILDSDSGIAWTMRRKG